MDNIAHALFGAGLFGLWAAANGGDVHTPLGAACGVAAIVGAEAPDVDVLILAVFGSTAYLKHHRQISHAIPMWFIYALLISGVLSIWVPNHFGLFFLLSLAGVLLHILLDVLNMYGTLALWPIVRRKLAWDIVPEVDIVYLVLFFLAVLAIQFHLPYATVVFSAWALAVLYTLLRMAARRHHLAVLRHEVSPAASLSLIPQLIPWSWGYVKEDTASFEMGHLKSNRMRPELRVEKPLPTPALLWTLRESAVAHEFMIKSRHFVWYEQRMGDSYQILVADGLIRFGTTLPFSASISVKPTTEGEFELLDESIRGQPIDLAALVADLSNESSAVSPNVYIPEPRHQ